MIRWLYWRWIELSLDVPDLRLCVWIQRLCCDKSMNLGLCLRRGDWSKETGRNDVLQSVRLYEKASGKLVVIYALEAHHFPSRTSVSQLTSFLCDGNDAGVLTNLFSTFLILSIVFGVACSSRTTFLGSLLGDPIELPLHRFVFLFSSFGVGSS